MPHERARTAGAVGHDGSRRRLDPGRARFIPRKPFFGSSRQQWRGDFLLTVKANQRTLHRQIVRGSSSTPARSLSPAMVSDAAMDATPPDTQGQNRLLDFIQRGLARAVARIVELWSSVASRHGKGPLPPACTTPLFAHQPAHNAKKPCCKTGEDRCVH